MFHSICIDEAFKIRKQCPICRLVIKEIDILNVGTKRIIYNTAYFTEIFSTVDSFNVDIFFKENNITTMTDNILKSIIEALKLNNTIKNFRFGTFSPYQTLINSEDLKQLLIKNSTLEYIDLLNNKIGGDKGAEDLAEGLTINKTLKALNLYGTKITHLGAIELAKALKSNKSLEYLNISNNSIGDAGAIALAEALKMNKTLTHLEIFKNYISNFGGQALAKALTDGDGNKTIKNINLNLNKIDIKIIESLNSSLEKNKIK